MADYCWCIPAPLAFLSISKDLRDTVMSVLLWTEMGPVSQLCLSTGSSVCPFCDCPISRPLPLPLLPPASHTPSVDQSHILLKWISFVCVCVCICVCVPSRSIEDLTFNGFIPSRIPPRSIVRFLHGEMNKLLAWLSCKVHSRPLCPTVWSLNAFLPGQVTLTSPLTLTALWLTLWSATLFYL